MLQFFMNCMEIDLNYNDDLIKERGNFSPKSNRMINGGTTEIRSIKYAQFNLTLIISEWISVYRNPLCQRFSIEIFFFLRHHDATKQVAV